MVRSVVFAIAIALSIVIAMVCWQAYKREPYFPPSFSKATDVCVGTSMARREPSVDDFEADWFSGPLRAAREPILYRPLKPGDPIRTFRFTWIPSFFEAIIVRLDETSPSQWRMTATRLSDPHEVVSRNLDTDEAASVVGLVDGSGLMSLPPKICDQGVDGDRWMFETRSAAGYQYINRWSPQNGTALEAGLAFYDLTGWDLGYRGPNPPTPRPEAPPGPGTGR